MRASALAAALALVLHCGCGVDDPYNQAVSQRGGTTLRPAGQVAPQPAVARPRPQSTPRRAANQFARAWINWRSDTLAAQQQRLVALATATWRRTLAAGRSSPIVLHSGVGLRGEILATRALGAHKVLVVTRERELPLRRGAQPAYRLYLADVRSVAGGWAVSRWEAQP